MQGQENNTLDLAFFQARIFCEDQFRKKLPGRSNMAGSSKQAIEQSAEASPKKSILYVEDCKDIREAFIRFLIMEGYAVFPIDSIAKAEELAIIEWFDH